MPTLIARDPAPDLILHGGAIHTLWPDLPRCSALAAKDGRVVALGDDDAVLALAGPRTELVDLAGRTAIPGINDAHNHMLELGLKLGRVALDSCASIDELVALVRAAAERTPEGEWVVGEGWNESLFAEGRLLTRHTPDPQGGRVERDAAGEPTGILRAAAKTLCRRLLPEPTEAERVAAIEAAGRAYLAVGITSVLEPGLRPAELRAYMRARREGRLPVRANLMPSWHGFHDDEAPAELDARAAGLGVFSGLGDPWLRLGGLKMAVDGGTTSRSAWMFQPFLGEEKVYDYNRLDPEDLREFFARGHALGWDIGIHAIGDRAHHEVAAAFADVLAAAPREHRHNLIHGYFASEQSLAQMARHGLAVVIQPTFIYYEGDDLFRDVGPELAHRYKPARTYLDRGIRVVATSDIPSTVHYNPFIGLYSLVTRRSWKGTPIAPGEAITREEALHAYSVAGAWLTREDDEKGPLAPGFLADLAVLDRDYFSCPEEQIKDILVDLTVVGGRVAHRRAGA